MRYDRSDDVMEVITIAVRRRASTCMVESIQFMRPGSEDNRGHDGKREEDRVKDENKNEGEDAHSGIDAVHEAYKR